MTETHYDKLRELAETIRGAIDADPNPDFVNTDQGYWDRQNGHIHIGVDGLIDCTLIAEAVLSMEGKA